MLAFVSFAPTLDLFGEGNEVRCVLHACISYVFIGTLARRKKTILSQLAIIIRVRHDTPHSLKYNKAARPTGNGVERNRGCWFGYRKMQQLTRLKA
jgi:hypothetical protein